MRISVVPEVSQIYKWAIGIGSSPIGYEGVVQPRKGQGETKTKLVIILSVTHTMYLRDRLGLSREAEKQKNRK